MVRDAVFRTLKYEAKVDGEATRLRIAALKSMMVDQMNTRAAELTAFEDSVKDALNEAGVVPTAVPSYLNFARECFRKKRKFSAGTLDMEVQIIYDKWKDRGLDTTVLQTVASVMGVTVLLP